MISLGFSALLLFTSFSDAAINRSLKKEKKITTKSVAQVISVQQKVDIKPQGTDTWKKASGNTPLSSSDKIRTGKKSVAKVRMDNGSTMLLLQNSEAEMEDLSSVQRTIKLLKGRVRAIVTRLKNAGDFKIKTPIGVASVRGTEFEVSFDEERKEMLVDVRQGQVGVSRLGDLADEVVVNPGESLKFGVEGELGDPLRTGALPLENSDVQTELTNDKVKDSVLAMAVEELRNADFQTGKSIIDVDGKRVRIDEYIMRPAADKFKLVSLNQRADRFDYFTYTGTFNTTLPDDLSIALKEVGGKTTEPTYYLTDYETLMSNTIDNITDVGSGGHLVKIEFDGTQYTLTDKLGNTRDVDAATLQNDGTYKIYNPLKDQFSYASAANKDEAIKISYLDTTSGEYKNFSSGDTFWKTRFNSSSYNINNTVKTAFSKKTSAGNVLAVDLDATFSNIPIVTISENPDGDGIKHNKLSLFYSDGSKAEFDNYIIDDEGQMATSEDFSGVSTSADYKNELNNWNYQTKITATEMSGEINLVIDPLIGTISGLIQ
jgi:FecR protein